VRVILLFLIVINYIFAYDGYYAPYKTGTSQIVSQGYDGLLSHYGGNGSYAVDFAGEFDIYPPKNGIVDKVGTSRFKIPLCVNNPQYWHGSANYLRIKHKDGVYSYYFHLKEINVSKGEKVIYGITKLGVSGNTGCSTSTHLHLQFSKAPNMNRESSLKIEFEDIGFPTKGNSYKSQNSDKSCTNFPDILDNKYRNEICAIAKKKHC
jgi:murein DD-endopeptidase MepM/ murein hydrolase activator NlpD